MKTLLFALSVILIVAQAVADDHEKTDDWGHDSDWGNSDWENNDWENNDWSVAGASTSNALYLPLMVAAAILARFAQR